MKTTQFVQTDNYTNKNTTFINEVFNASYDLSSTLENYLVAKATRQQLMLAKTRLDNLLK